MAHAFGIDFGGTGIKGAPVDLDKGAFSEERFRVRTPVKSTPEAVVELFQVVLDQFPEHGGPVGVTVPGVVRHGVVRTAANIDKSWIGAEADKLLSERTGRKVRAINDADAAGLAEVHYGAAKGNNGLVIVTTLGTGIGTALVYDGVLIPNTELGHLEINGRDAETEAANSARDREGLSWEEWAKRVEQYFRSLEKLVTPDLIVVGGGVSKHYKEWLPFVDIETKVVPAGLRNDAGAVGAALNAHDKK